MLRSEKQRVTGESEYLPEEQDPVFFLNKIFNKFQLFAVIIQPAFLSLKVFQLNSLALMA